MYVLARFGNPYLERTRVAMKQLVFFVCVLVAVCGSPVAVGAEKAALKEGDSVAWSFKDSRGEMIVAVSPL